MRSRLDVEVDASPLGNTSLETTGLVRFATHTGIRDIPQAVLQESKRCLLDYLGVAIGAANEPAPSLALGHVRELGSSGPSTVLGHADKVTPTDAAFVNGVMAHVFDFDDTHLPTILHATTPLYSSALAIAEWQVAKGSDVTGREILAAHAIGYEVSARISLALYPSHYDAGWHMTGTTGTLGAAIAADRLVGTDARTCLNAVGLAATQASGHREQFGSMAKSFHAGNAARNGLRAAMLAHRGFTAVPDPLQGRRGMFAVMSVEDATANDLVEGLGERWQIFDNGIKPYACGVVTHPVIDAALALITDHGVAVEDVKSIELTVAPLVVELTGKLAPRDGLEGKFSAVFAAAVSMIEGHARESQFNDALVRRPDVVDLMGRMRLIPDASTRHESASALAVLADGTEVRSVIKAATGTPENRISQDELTAKFHDLVDPVLGQLVAKQIIDLVDNFEESDSVAGMMSLASGNNAEGHRIERPT